MTCWQDHIVIYNNANVLIMKFSILDESYYLVVGSSHRRDSTNAGKLPQSVVDQLDRCLDVASSVGFPDDRKLLFTVFVDVIGNADRQRGIILYCYTNLP